MGFVKHAKADIIDVRYSKSRVNDISTSSFTKLAKPSEITEDGYLYVQVRAISSRVNKNNDGWPAEELAKSYSSFEGKPVFVDHNNDDPDRTRGVIVWSKLHVDDEKTAATDDYYSTDPDPEHLPPTWIELLTEVDAQQFPKLADAIISGDIDAVSMGCNVEWTRCSVCAHEANTPDQYCGHIQEKGAEFEIESATGEKFRKRAYENCYGVGFFEISYVFDPADETALTIEAKTKTAETAFPDEPGGEGLAEEYLRVNNNDPMAAAINLAQDLMQSDPGSFKQGYSAENAAIAAAAVFGLSSDSVLAGLGAPTDDLAGQGQTLDEADEEFGNEFGDEGEEEYVPIQNSEEDFYGQGADVLAWREEQFLAMGMDPASARALANTKADLHRVRDAINNGATPEQAYRIFSKREKKGLLDLRETPTEKNMENPAGGNVPQAEQPTAPEKVDTLRKDFVCPQCGSQMEESDSGQVICDTCGYEKEPEGFDNPDLDLAQEIDLQQREKGEVPKKPEEEVIPNAPSTPAQQVPRSPIPVPSPVAPIAKKSASVETVTNFPGGLHFATMAQITSEGLRANVTFPFGTFELPPDRQSKNQIMMGQVMYKRQNGVDFSDIPITVEAADEPTLQRVVSIIHSGGMERYSTAKNSSSIGVIDEMNITRKPLQVRRPVVWASVNYLRAAGSEIEDESELADLLNVAGIPATPLEAATAIEQYARFAAKKKKVIINDTTKTKGTDQPTDQRVISDQLAPVESSTGDEMDKNSDRKVIKRVEEDGQGVKRTEEIVEESGPLGTSDNDEPKAESEDKNENESEDSTSESESQDPQAESEHEPEAEKEEEKDYAFASTNGNLMAALKLAKLATSLGIISADDELNFAAEIEEETAEQIEARFDMLTKVKEAGLSKTGKKSIARLPSFNSSNNNTTAEEDDIPIEAIFL